MLHVILVFKAFATVQIKQTDRCFGHFNLFCNIVHNTFYCFYNINNVAENDSVSKLLATTVRTYVDHDVLPVLV